MSNIERDRLGTKLSEQVAETMRLKEVTEAQSRALEALRQRNVALRDQLRGAVETLTTARDELRAALKDSDQVLREYAEDAVEAIAAKLAALREA